jgi:hypothetical protein
MTVSLEPPAHAHHVSVSDGEAFIWQARPGVAVQRATGILSLPLAYCFAGFYRPILVPGAWFRIFNDFARVTHYTREAREYLTEFTLQRLFAVETIHFLMSSKLLALGVSVFKHDIGAEHVFTYADRSSFLRSYAQAMNA